MLLHFSFSPQHNHEYPFIKAVAGCCIAWSNCIRYIILLLISSDRVKLRLTCNLHRGLHYCPYTCTTSKAHHGDTSKNRHAVRHAYTHQYDHDSQCTQASKQARVKQQAHIDFWQCLCCLCGCHPASGWACVHGQRLRQQLHPAWSLGVMHMSACALHLR